MGQFCGWVTINTHLRIVTGVNISDLKMLLSLLILVGIHTYVMPENPHHIFSEQLQASVLETAFPPTEGNGRSSQAGLARYKSVLETRLADMLDKDGWIPARVLAKAISLDIDSSMVCLDLAAVDTTHFSSAPTYCL